MRRDKEMRRRVEDASRRDDDPSFCELAMTSEIEFHGHVKLRDVLSREWRSWRWKKNAAWQKIHEASIIT